MSDSDSILPSAVSLEDSSDDSDSSSSLESMTEFDDEKDSLLLKNFKEKEPKLEFSEWSLSKLRRLFLGQLITKEERTLFTVCLYLIFNICYINIVLTGLTPFFTRSSTMSIQKFMSCFVLENLWLPFF